MPSINSELDQSQPAPVPAEAGPLPAPVVMDPSLLMAASNGHCEALKSLLNWGDAPVRPAAVAPQVVVDVSEAGALDTTNTTGSLSVQPASVDAVAEGTNGVATPLMKARATWLPSKLEAWRCVKLLLMERLKEGVQVQQQNSIDAIEQGVHQPAVQHLQTAESLLEGITPHGETALHMVAKSGSAGEAILDSVYVIYNKAKHLLEQPNNRGDTPLHYAARAKNLSLLSYLVDLARDEQDGSVKVKAMLRKQNICGETVLHEAIRAGNEDIIILLLTEDSELARTPSEGTSPLYLAISLRKFNIVQQLYNRDNHLSYSGPDGQNALHAAVMRSKDITRSLLDWKKDLTKLGDHNGSTPLHLAVTWSRRNTMLLLEANPSIVFQPDKTGSFPIHIAASVGFLGVVTKLVEKWPNCVNLCDAYGRTFLHVAIQKKRNNITAFACQTASVESIFNMQDNSGNTALHVAILVGDLSSFCCLLSNRKVDLNIQNYSGQTPRLLSASKIPRGFTYKWNEGKLINRALRYAGSEPSVRRLDHLIEASQPADENKESDKLTDSTQTLSVVLVLVATVTFGATVALPGGYRADDHANGGTPTLAKRYAFDAFIMAMTLAFICSLMATLGLQYAGMAMVELRTRKLYFNRSLFFMVSSVASLVTAFALGVYLVLAPVSHKTAIAVCVVISVLLSVCGYMALREIVAVLRALHTRMGNSIHMKFVHIVCYRGLKGILPFIVIFGWAGISAKYHHV